MTPALHQRACDLESMPLMTMPCVGRNCARRWTCAHHAADQFASIRVVRMTECPKVDGERSRYVEAELHRPQFADQVAAVDEMSEQVERGEQ